jgi:hypothetical protein
MPIKWFSCLISFKWNGEDSWAYKNNKEDDKFQAVIPLADGSVGEIQHLGINEPIKTLGLRINDMPFWLQQGSYNVHADKREGVEGHNQGGEAKQEKCVINTQYATLAPNLLRTQHCNSLTPRVDGMPHEDMLQNHPSMRDQAHGQEGHQTACCRILKGGMPSPSKQVLDCSAKQTHHALWQPILSWSQHADIGRASDN